MTLATLGVLFAATVAASAAEPRPPHSGNDNRRLDLTISVSDDLRSVATRALFTFDVRDPLDPVWFTFPGVARPESLRMIRLNDQPVSPAHIHIDTTGGERHFVLDGVIGIRRGANRLVVSGVVANARPDYTHWGGWHPYLGSRAQRVPITAEVHVPRAYSVIASGRMVSDQVSGARRVARWRTNVPQGWIFLTIGKYRTREMARAPFRFIVSWPASDSAFDAGSVSGIPGRILRFYDEEFGSAGIHAFRLVEIPQDEIANFSVDGLIAITHGSHRAILRNPNYLNDVLAHELAHYWWGDLVTATGPASPWLTEGLAEYSRVLYERRSKSDSLSWAYRNLVAISEVGSRDGPSLMAPDVIAGLESVPYQKGAFVWRMLERELGGQSGLRDVLRDVVAEYRGRDLVIRDFIAIASRHARAPLDWFFHQWLERTGGPLLAFDSVRVAARADGEHLLGLIVQSGSPYRLRLPMRIEGGSDSSTRWLLADGPVTAFDLPVAARPRRIRLDVASEVFRWVPARDLPLDFRMVIGAMQATRCAFIAPTAPADSGVMFVTDFLARRFQGIEMNDRTCGIEVLVGPSARAFRVQHAAALPDPPPGSTTSFVRRDPVDNRRFVIGIEGDIRRSIPDILLPEAPLTFVAVRGDAIVAAYPPALPTIEARLPAP